MTIRVLAAGRLCQNGLRLWGGIRLEGMRTWCLLFSRFVVCSGAGRGCGSVAADEERKLVWASVQDAEQGHFAVT
jgi:hypothetical protein